MPEKTTTTAATLGAHDASEVVRIEQDGDTAATERDLDAAHDWLIAFVSACDISVSGHYFHMCDGQHTTCGCKWEGNDDPR